MEREQAGRGEKGPSEKDQVRERVPRVPRVSGKFWMGKKGTG